MATDPRTTEKARDTINWLISLNRGYRREIEESGIIRLLDPFGNQIEASRHPEVILKASPDWFSNELWPILFSEFPEGVALIRPIAEVLRNGMEAQFCLCLCQCGPTTHKVCQPGVDPGTAVALAWIAWKVAPTILPIEVQDISSAVH